MNATGIEADGAPQNPAASVREPHAQTGMSAPPCAPERELRVLRAPPHSLLTQVVLLDNTDQHNELVFENEWLLHPNEAPLALRGNLFTVTQPAVGDGVIILKTLALPHARPVESPADLRVSRAADFDGFDLRVVTSDPDETAATLHVLPFSGGALGLARALQNFQRAQRPQTPGHASPRAISNTWGDRNRDARICEEFVAREIAAAVRLGLDAVQLDDGWQKGATSNSVNARAQGGVWEGYWDADPDFWTPHPRRFPNGLEPLVELAASRGLALGLWFSPDSSDGFANWRRDADAILALHLRHRVCHFKLDGVKINSAAARHNFDSLLSVLAARSAGAIVIDLDITAQIRPGYFGAIPAGVLFVENRYTDWRSYWPHHALRNLWKLSRWLDPRRLRFEALNPLRNAEKYPADPLSPSSYAPDALLATVLASNPLIWCEVSCLPEPVATAWTELLSVWRNYRDEFFAGAILPIGDAPDGASWTGFLSLSPDERIAHLLIYRELNPSPVRHFALPFDADNFTVQLLAGAGELSPAACGAVATLPQKLGYLWARLERQ